MQFFHVSVVRVPVAEAYEWWTSFSEEDGSEEGPLLERRVLMASDQDFLVEDIYRYLGREITLPGAVELDPPHAYRIRYRGERLWADLRYMFNEIVEGTQLVVLGEVRGKGWLRLVVPLVWVRLRREIAAGIRENVRRVERLLLGGL